MSNIKLLILSELYSWWVHIFLIFCETRLEVHIKPFCTMKYIGCPKGKHLSNCFLSCNLNSHFFFFHGTSFFFFSNYIYSNLGIWQTFSQKQMKLACHFRENLSEFVVGDKVGAFKLYYNLGKLVSTIVSLTASQCFKYFFLMRSQWKQ